MRVFKGLGMVAQHHEVDVAGHSLGSSGVRPHENNSSYSVFLLRPGGEVTDDALGSPPPTFQSWCHERDDIRWAFATVP